MEMKLIKLTGVVVAATLLFTGCTGKVMKYKVDRQQQVNLDNIKPMNVQNKTLNRDNFKSDKARAARLESPHGNDFSDYLTYAIKEQLKTKGLLNTNSPYVLNVKLLEHDIDTGLVTTGTTTIKARVKLIKDGREIFNKVYTTVHTWDSHFIGQIAVDRAIENYPSGVHKFVNKLFSDEDFKNLFN